MFSFFFFYILYFVLIPKFAINTKNEIINISFFTITFFSLVMKKKIHKLILFLIRVSLANLGRV